MFLGSAPGVGKTHAMLSEGIRRAGRGADVVIGFLNDGGRSSLQHLAESLERLPVASGADATDQLDVAGVIRRQPRVVLVDELASRAGDSRGRWIDVETQTVPLLDDQGRLQGVAEIFRDLSRATRRPQEYRESDPVDRSGQKFIFRPKETRRKLFQVSRFLFAKN